MNPDAPRFRRWTLWPAFACLCIAGPGALGAADAEVVQLSPFEVVTEKDNTYRAEVTATATRISTPLRDVAQGTVLLTGELMRDLEARTVEDVVWFAPGVSAGAQDDGGDFEIHVRGLPVATYLRDNQPEVRAGMRSDVALIERVELVKGATSSLYGAASPGGAINTVSKRPRTQAAFEVRAQFGAFGLRRGQLDATGPMNEKRTLLYHVIAVRETADSFREHVRSDLTLVAPALTWIVRPGTQLALSAEITASHVTGDPGLPLIGAEEYPSLPRARFLGVLDRRYDQDRRVFRAVFDHRLDATWSMRAAISSSDLEITRTGGQLAGRVNLITRNVGRRLQVQQIDSSARVVQVDLLGRWRSGTVTHDLLLGADWRDNWQDNRRATINVQPGTLNVDAPDLEITREAAPVLNADNTARSHEFAFYAQDTARFWRDRGQLIAGLRVDTTRQNVTSLARPDPARRRVPTVTTPRLAFSFRGTRNVTAFASSSRAFRFDAAGRPFFDGETELQPEGGIVHEVGLKGAWLEDRLRIDLDVFAATRSNVVSADPDHNGYVIQTGRERSHGTGLTLQAEPTSSLSLLAGYSWAETEILADTDARLVGRRLSGVPRHSGSVYARYRVRDGAWQGFSVGGGGRWVGSRQGPRSAQLVAPAYGVVTAHVSYAWRAWTLNVSVNNLLDENYWASIGSPVDGNRLGAPRSWRASLSARW